MTAWYRAASINGFSGSSPLLLTDASSLISNKYDYCDNEVNLVMSKLDSFLRRKDDAKKKQKVSTPTDVHVIVLVHGILGNAMELDYLKLALEREADAQNKRSTMEDTYTTTSNDETCPSSSSSSVPSQPLSESSPTDTPFLVYRAHSNVGKTLDGVAAGGTRIADEINHLVQKIHERFLTHKSNSDFHNNNKEMVKVHLSFVGHSLGGLYSRHAVSKIKWKTTSSDGVIDDKINKEGAYPKVFCTTASPHLGLHQQSSVPVPRFVEQTIALTLQESGKDLFRMTPLLNQMAMEDMYVKPLQNFRSRLTYANAYGTDFQVPAVTAAFIVDDEQSVKHKRVYNDDDEDFVVLRMQTQGSMATEALSSSSSSSLNTNDNTDVDSKDGRRDEEEEQLIQPLSVSNSMLARHLDSMGWTKVWIDVRPLIPSLLPTSPEESRRQEQEETVRSLFSRGSTSAEKGEEAELITSKDIYQSGISQRFDITRFPMGHTVMVANSKSEAYATLNAAGRPIMDRLAKDLIKSIFSVN